MDKQLYSHTTQVPTPEHRPGTNSSIPQPTRQATTPAVYWVLSYSMDFEFNLVYYFDLLDLDSEDSAALHSSTSPPPISYSAASFVVSLCRNRDPIDSLLLIIGHPTIRADTFKKPGQLFSYCLQLALTIAGL